jgi:hypothetical protein
MKSGLTKIENGEYLFYPDFFSKSESNLFLQKLKDEIERQQEEEYWYFNYDSDDEEEGW